MRFGQFCLKAFELFTLCHVATDPLGMGTYIYSTYSIHKLGWQIVRNKVNLKSLLNKELTFGIVWKFSWQFSGKWILSCYPLFFAFPLAEPITGRTCLLSYEWIMKYQDMVLLFDANIWSSVSSWNLDWSCFCMLLILHLSLLINDSFGRVCLHKFQTDGETTNHSDDPLFARAGLERVRRKLPFSFDCYNVYNSFQKCLIWVRWTAVERVRRYVANICLKIILVVDFSSMYRLLAGVDLIKN